MSIGSGVFDPLGSENGGVPLTRRVAFTTVLNYHADCDESYWFSAKQCVDTYSARSILMQLVLGLF